MTIEIGAQMRKLTTFSGYAAVVIVSWLGAALVLTFASPSGKAMAIVGVPSQAIAAIAAADGRVVSSKGLVTIARSDDAHFVARLYLAGAYLVLDAEQAGGCSGLPPRTQKSQQTL